MALTLIVNPGSSSKKYTLVRDGEVISSFRFEKTVAGFDLCIEENGLQKKCEGISPEQFQSALTQVIETALIKKFIVSKAEIKNVGIRIVAPGSYFQTHQLVSDNFIDKLRERELSAPLHIPTTLTELEHLKQQLPQALVIAVSDSAFHASIPPWAREYSIAVQDTIDFDIYRFGYHGISVASIIPRLVKLCSGLPPKVAVAHIGSGVSITAVVNGKSIDTTMGFSPDSGLVMGTRAGDLDAGAVLELMRAKKMKVFDALLYIQQRGGLRGLCGESDFRFLLEKAAQRDSTAETALTHFVYTFKKQLGALVAGMGGIDTLVLTATAAERSANLRQRLLVDMDHLGIELNKNSNENLIQGDGIITTARSPVKVVVIRTQELQEMLRITQSFTT